MTKLVAVVALAISVMEASSARAEPLQEDYGPAVVTAVASLFNRKAPLERSVSEGSPASETSSGIGGHPSEESVDLLGIEEAMLPATVLPAAGSVLELLDDLPDGRNLEPTANVPVTTSAEVAPLPIPEPNPIAMIGIGLAALAFSRRKR
jgi:hypothetical protein